MNLLFLYCLFFVCMWTRPVEGQSHNDCDSTDKMHQIGAFVKGTLAPLSDQEFQNLMMGHYRNLNLYVDPAGWCHPEIEKVSASLMAGQTVVEACGFVDEVVSCSSQNAYLVRAINSIGDESVAHIKVKARQDGKTVFPDVVAYARVLENLTRAMRDNISLLDSLDQAWDRAIEEQTQKRSLLSYLSFFEYCKFHSVSLEGIQRGIQTGCVAPDFGRYGVAANILEATLTDWWWGLKDNAFAGWTLACSMSGGTHNPRTGEGPNYVEQFGSNKGLVHFNYPFARQWADLYTTWNLAFVSYFPDFPYVMAKLLVPSVMGYHQAPSGYIHNRAIALYVHLRTLVFQKTGAVSRSEAALGWNSDAFSRAFGKANKACAKDYKQKRETL